MHIYVQILIIVLIGAVLLWLGYLLFIRLWTEYRLNRPSLYKVGKSAESREPASSGDAQVCPICSSQLSKGDLIQTTAYPSLTGGKDRLMYIQGCAFCLSGGYDRKCPVCKVSLALDEILVARMFDRPQRRAHVHVLGCSRCRKLGIM